MTSDEKNFYAMQNKLLEIEKEADQEIIRAYAVAYREILGKIKKLYDKYAKNGDLSNMDKTELKRLTSIEQECIRILEESHAEVARIIKERSMFAYGESFFRHAYYIDDTYEVNLNWGKVPEKAVEVAVEDGFEMVANSKTFQQAKNPSIETLKEIFTNSLIEGKSYDKVKQEIVKKIGVETVADDAARYVGKGAASWANMVARTEIHRAISLGQKKTEEIVKDNGLDIEWLWTATLDGKTRPEHGALDGKKKDEEHDGWFVPSIGWVKGPGLSGVARFDINCRCCVIPVPAGTMPEERRVRGEGIVKYKTYDEWKKQANEGGAYKEGSRGVKGNDKKMKADLKYYVDEAHAFDDGPEYLKDAALKVNKETGGARYHSARIKSENYFDPNEKIISISENTLDKKEVFKANARHEMGHKIDWLFNKDGKLSSSQKFRDAMSKNYLNVIQNQNALDINDEDITEIMYIITKGKLGFVSVYRSDYYKRTGNFAEELFAIIIDKLGSGNNTVTDRLRILVPDVVSSMEEMLR